jgi:site-specific DNA-methyltransferase (adenine-specific)
MRPVVVSSQAFLEDALQAAAFYADPNTLIFNMEVCKALRLLAAHRMRANCIVTSPPFYGQRDYEVDGQIGLEEHPKGPLNNK